MIQTIANGLHYSSALLWAAVVLHILFDWKLAPEDKPADLARMGMWWRATWIAVALTPLTVSFGYIVREMGGLDSQYHRDLVVLGTAATRNAGAIMALGGFMLNRGYRLCSICPLFVIPFAFIGLAGLAA